MSDRKRRARRDPEEALALYRKGVETGGDEELGRLLASYGDEGPAEWAYTRALWSFR